MLICRLENEEDHKGPFEYPRRWDTMDGDGKDYITGFAEAVPWAEIAYIDGEPRSINTRPDHPHHIAEDLISDVDKDNLWFQLFGESMSNHEWRVGCANREQLEHWFPQSSWSFFAKWGFCIALYEVDEQYVHQGKYQSLFCLDQAQRVGTESLNVAG